MEKPIKILVDAPAWVGDMVMAQTLFKLIKHEHPEAIIDVLAPAWTRELLLRMPEVHQVWDAPGAHGELALMARYRLAKQLRCQRYDWSIVLRNSFKSALIPFWARIPKRTGWLGEWRYGLLNDHRTLDKRRYPRMIDRFMALALAPSAPLPAETKPTLRVTAAEVSDTLHALGLTRPQQPLLVLCPGAEYGPAKRWPETYFAAVANEKLQQGFVVWLLGSAKDAAITASINAQTQHRCVDLAGKTRLNQAVDLLSLATCVVSNDSGLMHVAAALAVPLVVMYGSSSPAFTPPLSDSVTTVSLSLACSPCFKRICPLTHMNCLRQLLPETVLHAMEKN